MMLHRLSLFRAPTALHHHGHRYHHSKEAETKEDCGDLPYMQLLRRAMLDAKQRQHLLTAVPDARIAFCHDVASLACSEDEEDEDESMWCARIAAIQRRYPDLVVVGRTRSRLDVAAVGDKAFWELDALKTRFMAELAKDKRVQAFFFSSST